MPLEGARCRLQLTCFTSQQSSFLSISIEDPHAMSNRARGSGGPPRRTEELKGTTISAGADYADVWHDSGLPVPIIERLADEVHEDC
jgi:hypothetical protein